VNALTWDDVLADLEARLDATTASGGGAIAPFTEPVVVAPLPEHLLSRAEAILERTERLTGDLEAQAQRIRTELRRIPRPTRRTSDRGNPLFEIGA